MIGSQTLREIKSSKAANSLEARRVLFRPCLVRSFFYPFFVSCASQPRSLKGVYNLISNIVHSFIMRLFFISLSIALYASIVAATPGQMGFSVGVVVNPPS